MDTSAIVKGSRKLTKAVKKNSPSILTAMGVGGLLTSVFLAIKATPAALEAIAMEEEYRRTETNDPDFQKPIDIYDMARVTWKLYLPTAGMIVLTSACIIGANNINLRRNAALASLLTIAETTLQEYQSKVVEQLGEKKEEKIRGEIAQDKLNKNPFDGQTVIMTKNGSMLCYDSLSGRYFYSDIETIRKVQNDFNRRLMSEMTIPLNDFYVELDMEPIEIGSQTGWTIEKGLMDLYFAAKLTKDGQPCIVLEHRNLPINIWG